MSILRFLGLSGSAMTPPSPSADTDTVRRIVATLDAMDATQSRWIAAFAYLLCRVARTDLAISDEEAAAMERILVERAGLSEAQAVLALEIAKHQQTMFGSTENFLVAREFAAIASLEQKLALLDCLFAVSAADESITTAEDNEIVRIAAELQLPREEVVAARGRYRGHLAVLKSIPGR